jgi:hypothetical protein
MNLKLTICALLALGTGIALADGDHDRDHWRHDRDSWVRHSDWRWRHEHAVYVTDSIVDLQFEIDHLNIELVDLRRGPWFHGRDDRCRDLEGRIRADRDRIAVLRRR